MVLFKETTLELHFFCPLWDEWPPATLRWASHVWLDCSRHNGQLSSHSELTGHRTILIFAATDLCFISQSAASRSHHSHHHSTPHSKARNLRRLFLQFTGAGRVNIFLCCRLPQSAGFHSLLSCPHRGHFRHSPVRRPTADIASPHKPVA